MDVDIDDVLRRFNVLATTDKDTLISQFQSFVGDDAKQFVCEFFLEMANWNLQAALCAYYDTQAETSHVDFKMTPIDHLEDNPELIVSTHSAFRKGWRVRNSGTSCWSNGCSLRFVSTSRLRIFSNSSPSSHPMFSDPSALRSLEDRISVPSVPPGCSCDLWATFEAPPTVGTYQFELRLCTASGTYFGDSLWMVIKVRPAAENDTCFDVHSMRASLVDATQTQAQMPIDESDLALSERINSLRLAEAAAYPAQSVACIDSLSQALRHQAISASIGQTDSNRSEMFHGETTEQVRLDCNIQDDLGS